MTKEDVKQLNTTDGETDLTICCIQSHKKQLEEVEIIEAKPVPTEPSHNSTEVTDDPIWKRLVITIGGKPAACLIAFGTVAVPLTIVGGPSVACLSIVFAGTFLLSIPYWSS
jgi:hypothetical protein